MREGHESRHSVRPETVVLQEYSLRELLLYFLKLGTLGFGGPIALVGYMERDLVEEKRWISREEYVRGLALAQLAPGPLAAQLAIYLGYVKYRVLGATLVAIAFILPSFIMVVIIGMIYVAYGGLEWMQALFYGIGAAVIGIIVRSAYKLTKITLKNSALLWMIFVIMCGVTAYTEQENVWLFILSGVVALAVKAWPSVAPRAGMFVPTLGFSLLQTPQLGEQNVLSSVFLFFVQAGAFVFGSGLAIVPFLYGGVVQEHHWLTERQFLDAVAVAMITPGPVVITVGFIGYLIAQFPGAVVAALGVFLPVYLFVVIPAPYFERYAKNQKLVAFVDGVTAAATGAIAGAVIVLGRRAIIDLPTAAIALGALMLLLRFKIREPILIALAGATGLLLYYVH
jgi:chromate transporter